MRYEVQIPFSGFYGSIHEGELDREVENLADYWAEDIGTDIPQSLMDLFWDSVDWPIAQLEYVKAYVESFGAEYLDGDCEFVTMTSPREYNFETDRAFATVGRSTLAKIYRGASRDVLTRIAKERHTSRDGFISFYDPNWRSWGVLSDWDHNQLETLLFAYLETERGESWNQWAEYELCEDLSSDGEIHSWVWSDDKCRRPWRIFNYMRDRAQRSVKTMAQWRIAYAKPWESTELGAWS